MRRVGALLRTAAGRFQQVGIPVYNRIRNELRTRNMNERLAANPEAAASY